MYSNSSKAFQSQPSESCSRYFCQYIYNTRRDVFLYTIREVASDQTVRGSSCRGRLTTGALPGNWKRKTKCRVRGHGNAPAAYVCMSAAAAAAPAARLQCIGDCRTSASSLLRIFSCFFKIIIIVQISQTFALRGREFQAPPPTFFLYPSKASSSSFFLLFFLSISSLSRS